MTWSPGFTLVTPSPTSTTTPAPSWPRTAGKTPSGSSPDRVKASVWQTPVLVILTRTSPLRGGSTSISTICNGFPASKATAARDFMAWSLKKVARPGECQACVNLENLILPESILSHTRGEYSQCHGYSCAVSGCELDCQLRYLGALRKRQFQLGFRWLSRAVGACNSRCAVRRAAFYLRHVELRLHAIAGGNNNHAVMRKRVPERRDRGFLTAQSAGGGEDAADFTGQCAFGPKTTGLIQKCAHLAAHIAETGRGTKNDGVVVGQFRRCCNRCGLIGFSARCLE